jgi:hypothetical protein
VNFRHEIIPLDEVIARKDDSTDRPILNRGFQPEQQFVCLWAKKNELGLLGNTISLGRLLSIYVGASKLVVAQQELRPPEGFIVSASGTLSRFKNRVTTDEGRWEIDFPGGKA